MCSIVCMRMKTKVYQDTRNLNLKLNMVDSKLSLGLSGQKATIVQRIKRHCVDDLPITESTSFLHPRGTILRLEFLKYSMMLHPIVPSPDSRDASRMRSRGEA